MASTVSVLKGTDNNYETTSAMFNGPATDFFTEGVIGTKTNTAGVAPATGAFAVNAQGTPNMTVAVTAGVAYVTATPTGQLSQLLRVVFDANENVTIAANSSGSTKYDWIYISISAANADAPNSGGTNVATLVASRSTSASTDDGTPPTYGYPLAVVTVANGAATIANASISDVRDSATLSRPALNQVAFSAVPSGAQTGIADVTATKVNFATEVYDIGGNFSSSRFTAPFNGIYSFTAALATGTTAVSDILILFYVNGVEVKRTGTDTDTTYFTGARESGTAELPLNEDDYVEIYVNGNTSGAAFDLVSSAASTWFVGHLITQT